jgi:hypothetical protein
LPSPLPSTPPPTPPPISKSAKTATTAPPHTTFGKIDLEISIDAVATHADDSLLFFITENSTLLSNALLGDANLDGKVDLTDLNDVLNHLGTSLPAGGATSPFSIQNSSFSIPSTPEPATLALLALSPLLTRRRRLSFH